MSAVLCNGVTAGYNGTHVLEHVDLSVTAGSWVAVIGPNGAGKSTLLKAIAGTMPLRSGSITFEGRVIEDFTPRSRAKLVAMVPQHPLIPEGMTVFDYVLLGRTPHIPYWRNESAEDLRITHDVLARLDVDRLSERAMGSLSGGERQRVVLGRALAQDAGVLLLDEPTTALDIGHQQQVFELVDELRLERSIAVISAVHDLTLAAQYADRLVLLADGFMVAGGTAAEILTPTTVRKYFDADVSIIEDGSGGLVVAPRRVRSTTPVR